MPPGSNVQVGCHWKKPPCSHHQTFTYCQTPKLITACSFVALKWSCKHKPGSTLTYIGMKLYNALTANSSSLSLVNLKHIRGFTQGRNLILALNAISSSLGLATLKHIREVTQGRNLILALTVTFLLST